MLCGCPCLCHALVFGPCLAWHRFSGLVLDSRGPFLFALFGCFPVFCRPRSCSFISSLSGCVAPLGFLFPISPDACDLLFSFFPLRYVFPLGILPELISTGWCSAGGFLFALIGIFYGVCRGYGGAASVADHFVVLRVPGPRRWIQRFSLSAPWDLFPGLFVCPWLFLRCVLFIGLCPF